MGGPVVSLFASDFRSSFWQLSRRTAAQRGGCAPKGIILRGHLTTLFSRRGRVMSIHLPCRHCQKMIEFRSLTGWKLGDCPFCGGSLAPPAAPEAIGGASRNASRRRKALL